MPRITSLEAQKHDPERVNVYVDGEFVSGASLFAVATRGLRIGDEISAEQLDELRHEDAVERAQAAALNFLSFRPRSRRELQDYFRKRQVDEAVSEAALERLSRLGLVDDREFARFWVENRQTFRPRGSRALRMEMRQKGLDGEIIDEALEELGDEEQTAIAAGRAKLRSYRSLDERDYFRKMTAFLARRGFGYEVSARAARALRESADSIAPQEDEPVD